MGITFVANFMVFNLFVAILLEAFNVENLNEKGNEKKVNEKKTATIKRGIEHFSEMLKEKKRNLRNSFRKSKKSDIESGQTVNNINGGHPLHETNHNADDEQADQRENTRAVRFDPDSTDLSQQVHPQGVVIDEQAFSNREDKTFGTDGVHDRKFSAAS